MAGRLTIIGGVMGLYNPPDVTRAASRISVPVGTGEEKIKVPRDAAKGIRSPDRDRLRRRRV